MALGVAEFLNAPFFASSVSPDPLKTRWANSDQSIEISIFSTYRLVLSQKQTIICYKKTIQNRMGV